MRFLHASLFAVAALAACSLTACQKGGDAVETPPAQDTSKWPEPPKDGSNVRVVFKKLVGEGKDRQGLFDVYNYSKDENVSELRMRLEYRDKDDKVIKTFPHTQMKAFYSSEKAELKAGFFLPEETVTITAVVHYVKFNTQEWGSKVPKPAKTKYAPKVVASAAPASAAPASAK